MSPRTILLLCLTTVSIILVFFDTSEIFNATEKEFVLLPCPDKPEVNVLSKTSPDAKPIANGQMVNLNTTPETPKKEPERFALIAVVRDMKNKDEYKFALKSVECYAGLHGYPFYHVDISANATLQKECNQTDIMFQRHCVTELIMRSLPHEWFVFLDADIGVINPMRRLEEYVPNDGVHMLFYNRFYNDELTSGSYFARNTERGRGFLKHWANYFYHMPNTPQHGTDNGALHSAFTEYFHPELNKHREMCEKIWKVSKNYNDLFDYEACIREILLKGNKSSEYVVYEKGHGWCRDGWLSKGRWSVQDLMFHGWKQWKVGGEWDFQFKNNSFTEKCEGPKAVLQWKMLEKYMSSPTEVWIQLADRLNKTKQEHNDRIAKMKKEGHYADSGELSIPSKSP